MDVRNPAKRHVVGGVDTHKDLHVAAVVDERDRVLGSQSFATTRQGYRQMLAWMGSFGEVQRIGIEYGFYNPVRRHSALDFASPAQFEKAATQ